MTLRTEDFFFLRSPQNLENLMAFLTEDVFCFGEDIAPQIFA